METKIKKININNLNTRYRNNSDTHIGSTLRVIVTPKPEDNSFSNMKKIWTYIKSKKTDCSGVSSLKQDGRLITDPKHKSNALNDQFQSVFSEPVNITPSEFIHNNYMQDPRHYPVMKDIHITSPGIEQLLKKTRSVQGKWAWWT